MHAGPTGPDRPRSGSLSNTVIDTPLSPILISPAPSQYGPRGGGDLLRLLEAAAQPLDNEPLLKEVSEAH